MVFFFLPVKQRDAARTRPSNGYTGGRVGLGPQTWKQRTNSDVNWAFTLKKVAPRGGPTLIGLAASEIFM